MVFLVVDINVVLSALISHGDSSKVFKLNSDKRKFDLIAPQFILIEAGKHLAEIAKRSSLPFGEAQEDLELITSQIKFFPEEDYKDKLKEAKDILKEHEKDSHYLALALKFNCDVFSGDKVFKQLCPDKVKNPREILDELDK